MAYIDVPVEAEPVDLAGEAFQYLEDKVPGWLPAEGNLESWLIESLAQIAGEERALIALVPDSIFAYFGGSIMGLPQHQAVAATGTTTWTAVDNKGYTVDAGTLIAISPPALTDAYTFQVVATFQIPSGQTTVSGVQVQAIEPGAASSGITGPVQVLDQLVFISTVTLDAPTSGGVDAETMDAYLDRLSDLMTLLSPRPILPQDFAVLAQRSVDGVARATAIDLYNPGPPINANCPRCVTVAICDVNGQPCSAAIKQQVDDLLQSEREVNFLVFVVDPTYTVIDVTYDAMAYAGYQSADVQAAVSQALADYLSPANWGVPPFGDTSARSWVNDTHVRYLELTEVVNRVDGVWYVKTLQLRVSGGTFATTDVTLTGVAPMPQPGSISGTVEVAT